MKDKISLIKLWVKKAESDFITAYNSLKIKPHPPLDTVCFHAQQCAEKYLKASLTCLFPAVLPQGVLVEGKIENRRFSGYYRS